MLKVEAANTPRSLLHMTTPKNQSKSADDADFLKNMGIGFVMHELKGPLAVIEAGLRGMLAGKSSETALSPRQQRTLQRMLRSTLKSRELVAELLAIGQPVCSEPPSAVFDPAVALRKVVDECLEMYTPASSYQDLMDSDAQTLDRSGIVVSIAPDIEALKLQLSESNYCHVCSNLIRNAMRFKSRQISISASLAAGSLAVDVTDDGPGIPLDFQEAIFEPYIQVRDATWSQSKGHGLGLAIARTLARQMGGDVVVESHVGEGSRFRMTLPLPAHT